MGHWWHAYWAWAGSNIGAMPAEFIITAAATVLLLKPLKLAWHHLVGRHLQAAARAAEASHRIAADLYEHHTGRAHQLAPANRESEAK